MNKFALPVVLATALISTASMAAGGTITFNGKVTGTTCDVVVNNGTKDATITLPTVSADSLDATGKVAGRTAFYFNLSNCVIPPTNGLSNVAAFFEYGLTVQDGKLVNKSPAASAATNVLLQILDGTTGDAIAIGEASQNTDSTFYPITNNSARLPYSVQYYAKDAVTPGDVTSSVVYSIAYK